jgi:hypothetical protein
MPTENPRDVVTYSIAQARIVDQAAVIPPVPMGFLNVREFGALGDGVTNDTAAILACFAAAIAGSVVLFPPGRYLLKNYVTIGADGVTVMGYGATILSDASGQDRKFLISGRSGVKIKGLTIDGGGLTVLANAAAFDTYTPNNQPGTIHIYNSTRCEVAECYIHGVNWPVTILGASDGIRVCGNTFATYYAAVYSYFASGDSGQPSPRRVTVTENVFQQGIHYPSNTVPFGWAREIPPNDIWCSGAVKFRGTPTDQNANYFYGHVVTDNIVNGSGQVGLELQAVNDCTVTANTVENANIGISLSFTQKTVVGLNTIRNCFFACIEVDGRTDFNTDPTLVSNESTILSGNMLDGRDSEGRPTNFVYSFGIIVSHVGRNVTITGGSIKYCKTAITVNQASSKVLISGVRIETNEESGTGGNNGFIAGPMPWVQGIYIIDSEQIDIIGCDFRPTFAAWQRMVNIINSDKINIRGCTITANNTCIYAQSVSDLAIEECKLISGTDHGGTNTAFITVESTYEACANIRIRNNTFVGAFEYGALMISPSNSVSPLLIQGNDTTQASATAGNFLTVALTTFGGHTGGTRGHIVVQDNRGPATATISNSFEVPLRTLVTADGPFDDQEAYSRYSCTQPITINLQVAPAFAGVTKMIMNTAAAGSVTIHPAGGQTINGSGSDLVLTHRWSSVTLISDGANWIAISTPSVGALKQVSKADFTHDFGTVGANNQAFVNVTVDCPTGTANKPTVSIGWFANLPIGVQFKQAYISGSNQATVVIANPTGGDLVVGSMDFSLTVFEY